MRDEHAADAGVGERQSPLHIERQRCGRDVDVDPAVEQALAAADVQLEIPGIGRDLERGQLAGDKRPAQGGQFTAQRIDRRQ